MPDPQYFSRSLHPFTAFRDFSALLVQITRSTTHARHMVCYCSCSHTSDAGPVIPGLIFDSDRARWCWNGLRGEA